MADQIRPTQRSPILGLFSDLVNLPLQYMSSPQRTQQMQGLASLIRSTGVPYTLESLSYDPSGRGLFTGAGGLGGTTRLRPEAVEAALTVAPMVGPAARVAERGAMAVGRAGERYAERVVPKIMERGGLPAEMVAAMGQGTQSPLTVYHGSPYRFQRFDPTKIGSGEGAQAYGYGHYVAESPAVAQAYRDMLSVPRNDASEKIDFNELNKFLGSEKESVNRQIKKFIDGDGYFNEFVYEIRRNGSPKLQKMLQQADPSIFEFGSFYTIDLPDKEIARMLDYNKPLSKQSKEIQEKLKSVVDQQLGTGVWDQWIKNNPDFRDLQNDLLEGKTQAEVAELIRQAGIPGIRYLDEGSRGVGQGTSNFVVFPGGEDLLKIVDTNPPLRNPIMYEDPFGSSVR